MEINFGEIVFNVFVLLCGFLTIGAALFFMDRAIKKAKRNAKK